MKIYFNCRKEQAMQKTNTVSSLPTRLLMVGCLLSGSFAFTGEAEALTLPVEGGKSVAVKSVTIAGPGLKNVITVSGPTVDKFAGLRAKGVAFTGVDFGSALFSLYRVTVVGADGKTYAPVLAAGATATANGNGAEGIILQPAK